MAQKKWIIIKTNSPWDLVIHLGLIFFLGSSIVLSIFTNYLPWITSHGETVTVPDITGMNVTEIEQVLGSRDLDFEIKDSTYSKKHKPYTVLAQSPSAGERVKQSRKIYITISPRYAPKIRMPKLMDMPFKDAEMILRNNELELGRIKYVPFFGENVVLKQYYLGKEISPGTMIPKGSKVDLVIGDGLGETEFPVPNVVGLPLDEAELIIKGSELLIGIVTYDYNSREEIGTVLRQTPSIRAGKVKKGVEPFSPADDRPINMIRAGEVVDLWVSGNPAPPPRTDEDEEDKEEDEQYDNINIRDREELERIQREREEEEGTSEEEEENN